MSRSLPKSSNAIAADLSAVPPSEMWVELYGNYLFSYAMRYVRRESVAEDLVQDALVSALQSVSRFEGRSAFKSWITGILRHKILDFIRAESKGHERLIQDVGEKEYSSLFNDLDQYEDYSKITPWNLDPEKVTEQKQFIGALEECMSKLPEAMRRIFMLREIEELDRSEICNAVGLTSTNVGVILHRARVLLRECLEVSWVQPGGAKA